MRFCVEAGAHNLEIAVDLYSKHTQALSKRLLQAISSESNMIDIVAFRRAVIG